MTEEWRWGKTASLAREKYSHVKTSFHQPKEDVGGRYEYNNRLLVHTCTSTELGKFKHTLFFFFSNLEILPGWIFSVPYRRKKRMPGQYT